MVLVERGFDVLVVDLSPPGSDVVVPKAIVLGLEVETMSYGRCGSRNLDRLLERDLGLVGVGVPPDGALVLPLYREPSRHVAALALAREWTGRQAR